MSHSERKETCLQCMCTFFSKMKSSLYSRFWSLWLHKSSVVVMKTCVQNEIAVYRSVNKLYWLRIIFRAFEVTYDQTCWKINARRIMKNLIFAFSIVSKWLWCSLISNKLMSFIIVLRSSMNDLKRRFSIAWSLSSRDVVIVSKCRTRFVKHLTKRSRKSSM